MDAPTREAFLACVLAFEQLESGLRPFVQYIIEVPFIASALSLAAASELSALPQPWVWSQPYPSTTKVFPKSYGAWMKTDAVVQGWIRVLFGGAGTVGLHRLGKPSQIPWHNADEQKFADIVANAVKQRAAAWELAKMLIDSLDSDRAAAKAKTGAEGFAADGLLKLIRFCKVFEESVPPLHAAGVLDVGGPLDEAGRARNHTFHPSGASSFQLTQAEKEERIGKLEAVLGLVESWAGLPEDCRSAIAAAKARMAEMKAPGYATPADDRRRVYEMYLQTAAQMADLKVEAGAAKAELESIGQCMQTLCASLPNDWGRDITEAALHRLGLDQLPAQLSSVERQVAAITSSTQRRDEFALIDARQQREAAALQLRHADEKLQRLEDRPGVALLEDHSDIFVSLRLGEARRQALELKAAIEAERPGVKCFVSGNNPNGEYIDELICNALHNCRLVIIMGSRTYGLRTESAFSTFQELQWILQTRKPLFLVKMCEGPFEVSTTQVKLGSNIKFRLWLPGTAMPEGLVNEGQGVLVAMDADRAQVAAALLSQQQHLVAQQLAGVAGHVRLEDLGSAIPTARRLSMQPLLEALLSIGGGGAGATLPVASSSAGPPSSSSQSGGSTASSVMTITMEGSLSGPPPFDCQKFKERLASKLDMTTEQLKLRTVSRGGRRNHEVQTSPGLSIRVEVDEEGYLTYESSGYSSEDGSEASDLSAAETDIQSAVRLALRPQRRITPDAIEVLWTKEGSIIVCVKLDLPYALKLMDLYLRGDSSLKDELRVVGVGLVTASPDGAAMQPEESSMRQFDERAMPPARAAAPSLPPCSDCGAKSDFDLELGKATSRCGMVMPYRPAPARQAAKKSPTRIQKWYAEMSRRLGGLPSFVVKDASRMYHACLLKDKERQGCKDLDLALAALDRAMCKIGILRSRPDLLASTAQRVDGDGLTAGKLLVDSKAKEPLPSESPTLEKFVVLLCKELNLRGQWAKMAAAVAAQADALGAGRDTPPLTLAATVCVLVVERHPPKEAPVGVEEAWSIPPVGLEEKDLLETYQMQLLPHLQALLDASQEAILPTAPPALGLGGGLSSGLADPRIPALLASAGMLAACKFLNLDKKGHKSDLAARLEEWYEREAAPKRKKQKTDGGLAASGPGTSSGIPTAAPTPQSVLGGLLPPGATHGPLVGSSDASAGPEASEVERGVGAVVEVMPVEESFRGSRYEAVVLETDGGRTKIRFTSFTEEEAEWAAKLRVGSLVEMYADGGWWDVLVGEMSTARLTREVSYLCRSPNSGDEHEVTASYLRPRWEWRRRQLASAVYSLLTTVQPPPVADVTYISVAVVAPRAMQKGETLRCALPNGSFFQLPISGNIAAGTPLGCKVPQKAPPPQPVRFLIVPPGMGYGAKVTALSPNGHVAHVGVPLAPPPPGSRMAVPVPQEQAARFEGPTAYERLQQQRRSAGQLISRKARNHEKAAKASEDGGEAQMQAQQAQQVTCAPAVVDEEVRSPTRDVAALAPAAASVMSGSGSGAAQLEGVDQVVGHEVGTGLGKLRNRTIYRDPADGRFKIFSEGNETVLHNKHTWTRSIHPAFAAGLGELPPGISPSDASADLYAEDALSGGQPPPPTGSGGCGVHGEVGRRSDVR
ncbi:hypothetical protein EMIHUDRAFT_220626 [Emiliania huxleyi CCMP1516]|uniref:SAP domain-containing protein n=2 Tax=Emiliania huxleyi TaxID=2903 RepID=A0A0D3I0Q9_EMIH1|nr:hypothetical protein EMIHUDRAFT_220626 [Emiliania huxleyi CCMP1516]EOD04844.1 hypothetical protein EMIHUDRAFT_220626 [Emiliania huxleyi CCMP1516]|eukprot:XP_005757273.1 hypothetical protein EMIHUDRAFT_220626 [Emiliania huxleyi CCMP1516]